MAKGVYERASLKVRFEQKVLKVDSGCHEWQSTLHRDGYGKVWVIDRQVPAHRASYQLYKGDIPAGMMVLHTCDNRKCVNPNHLYAGDAKQNTADKIARCQFYGRMKIPFETITEIRRLYATGNFTQNELAAKYGIGQTQVSRYILNRQRILK
jgi:hypothetical protein